MRHSVAAALAAVATLGLTTLIDQPSVSDAADVATVECGPVPTEPTSPALQASTFVGQTPERLVDTRIGTGGVGEPVGDECVLRLDVSAAGIPDEAIALSLSVTALGSVAGFQQVFPCDRGRPASSNVNNRADRFPTPNLVIGQPDDDREICIYTFREADLIVDVSGWWTERGDERFRAVDPVRVDDSRESTGRATGDFEVREIDLTGFVPAGTTSIVGNLTVAQPSERGFLTIFPCGTEAPTASNINFAANENRAVGVVVGLDANLRVCTASNTEHHVILDLAGYYAPGPTFGPAAALRPEPGTRLADSRNGTGGWNTPLSPGETRSLDVTSALPDRSQVTGVILNVTVARAQRAGFVTVTRCGEEPTTSSVNYNAGTVASNLVVVDLAAGSSICVFSRERTDVIVDLFGVLRADSDEMLVERFDIGAFTWPPYDPNATDYATECVDPLPLDLDLLPGTSARVNGVSVAAGNIDVGLAGPNDLVRLEFRRGADVQRVHLRCVPDDFRRAEVTVSALDPEPGWYLIRIPGVDGSTERVAILDEYGAPIWFRDVATQAAVFEVAADGNLLLLPARNAGLSADPDRGGLKFRLDGSVIEEYITVDGPTENPTDHHDIVELPGGGVTLISYPLLENVDLTGMPGDFGADETIADNLLQELDADGNLVWEWRMSDHFVFEPGADPPTLVYTHDTVEYPVVWTGDLGHPGVDDVDVFHINSVELTDDATGDYIVSARHMDAIFRIDRVTGDVEWILRSDEVGIDPKAGADTVLNIVDDPLGGPRRPHDAILTGDLLTFLDNRPDTGQPTRAVTYQIDTSAPGAGTATLVDSIAQPDGATSFGLGSFRPGPSGSRVVNWGGGVQPVFQQFDSLDRETIRWVLPSGNTYRAVWYPASTFNEIELRATAGGIVQIPD